MANQTGTAEEFNQILLNAIDETLSSLGNPARKSIYFYMDEKFRVKQSEIPNKITEFMGFLERIFGQGADRLEIQIIKCLYAKTGCTEEWREPKELALSECVEKVKAKFVCSTNKDPELAVFPDSGANPEITET